MSKITLEMIYNELTDLKKDISSIKKDVSSIKKDITEIKEWTQLDMKDSPFKKASRATA